MIGTDNYSVYDNQNELDRCEGGLTLSNNRPDAIISNHNVLGWIVSVSDQLSQS